MPEVLNPLEWEANRSEILYRTLCRKRELETTGGDKVSLLEQDGDKEVFVELDKAFVLKGIHRIMFSVWRDMAAVGKKEVAQDIVRNFRARQE